MSAFPDSTYSPAARTYDDGATLDDLRESVLTFEDTERISRRVMGDAHTMLEALHGGGGGHVSLVRPLPLPPPRCNSEWMIFAALTRIADNI